MVARSEAESKEHKKLIKDMATTLKNDGHTNIKADHSDYEDDPEPVNGHIPDITSSKEGTSYITEAETCESIDDSHTKEQWKAFDKANGKFLIVVPKEGLEKARKRKKDLNVDAKIYY